MTKLLLDANLSPETGEYLRENFSFNVIDLITENKGVLTDEKVVLLAKKERRIIVTFDLDFGEIYHFREKGKIGVIVLRLQDQRVESVNKTLYKFFNFYTGYKDKFDLNRALIILEEEKIRINKE